MFENIQPTDQAELCKRDLVFPRRAGIGKLVVECADKGLAQLPRRVFI